MLEIQETFNFILNFINPLIIILLFLAFVILPFIYFYSLRKLSRKKKIDVKNSKVNDFQKIKTSTVEIPVIKATVLEYEPGELGEKFPDRTKLYYSPEAISDKDFLESILLSPIQVQTHEKNTSEYNLDVNGWSREAWFNDKDKTTYLKGVLIGSDNIQYAKENVNKPGFGTSAFISFLDIEKKPGVTPDGLQYDAIAKKAICNHVAILENIRDKENKIVSINAKNAIIKNSQKEEIKMAEEKKESSINQDDFEKAYQAMMDKKNSLNEMKEQIKNELREEMKNAKNEDKPEEKKEEKTIPNEEPKKEEDTKAENALPSEKIIGIYSDVFNTTFQKTPTFKELGDLAGVSAKSFPELVQAVNAKAKEFSSSIVEVQNSESENRSINEILREF